ncbi:hypothetical protein JL721_2733 [Aureococcus anophagefferens]|nr:hypothetical protein JL721_2733 [Aureococcus anophagefferens]
MSAAPPAPEPADDAARTRALLDAVRFEALALRAAAARGGAAATTASAANRSRRSSAAAAAAALARGRPLAGGGAGVCPAVAARRDGRGLGRGLGEVLARSPPRPAAPRTSRGALAAAAVAAAAAAVAVPPPPAAEPPSCAPAGAGRDASPAPSRDLSPRRRALSRDPPPAAASPSPPRDEHGGWGGGLGTYSSRAKGGRGRRTRRPTTRCPSKGGRCGRSDWNGGLEDVLVARERRPRPEGTSAYDPAPRHRRPDESDWNGGLEDVLVARERRSRPEDASAYDAAPRHRMPDESDWGGGLEDVLVARERRSRPEDASVYDARPAPEAGRFRLGRRPDVLVARSRLAAALPPRRRPPASGERYDAAYAHVLPPRDPGDYLPESALTYDALLALDRPAAPSKAAVATKKQLISKALTTSVYRKPAEPTGEEDNECCICLDEFEDEERIKKLRCGHLFHLNCIKKWLLADTRPTPPPAPTRRQGSGVVPPLRA